MREVVKTQARAAADRAVSRLSGHHKTMFNAAKRQKSIVAIHTQYINKMDNRLKMIERSWGKAVIASKRNYELMKTAFLGFKAARPPRSQASWSWAEVVKMAKENKIKLYWVRDKGELWVHDGETETSNVEVTKNVCTQTQRRCQKGQAVPPEGSYYETM